MKKSGCFLLNTLFILNCVLTGSAPTFCRRYFNTVYATDLNVCTTNKIKTGINIATHKQKSFVNNLNIGVTYSIKKDPRFGQVFIDIPKEDFLKSGVEYGDSLSIIFKNKDGKEYVLKDIPFYSGYNNRTGEYLVVDHKTYDHIAIGCNNSNNFKLFWENLKLTENGSTVTINIFKKGKYLTIENAMKLCYSNNLKDYKKIDSFANFRNVSGGRLKENLLYRGPSPFDNKYGRCNIVNALIKDYGIEFILNLADTEEHVAYLVTKNKLENSYSTKLSRAVLGLDCAFKSKKYAKKIVDGLLAYVAYCKQTSKPAKLYVHCLEGKDRTGFVCIILEMLSGFNYEKILNDYMKTYKNYYGITKERTPEKYAAIKEIRFDAFFEYLQTFGSSASAPLTPEELETIAKNYLKFGGMSEEQITEFQKLLLKNDK